MSLVYVSCECGVGWGLRHIFVKIWAHFSSTYLQWLNEDFTISERCFIYWSAVLVDLRSLTFWHPTSSLALQSKSIIAGNKVFIFFSTTVNSKRYASGFFLNVIMLKSNQEIFENYKLQASQTYFCCFAVELFPLTHDTDSCCGNWNVDSIMKLQTYHSLSLR